MATDLLLYNENCWRRRPEPNWGRWLCRRQFGFTSDRRRSEIAGGNAQGFIAGRSGSWSAAAWIVGKVWGLAGASKESAHHKELTLTDQGHRGT